MMHDGTRHELVMHKWGATTPTSYEDGLELIRSYCTDTARSSPSQLGDGFVSPWMDVVC